MKLTVKKGGDSVGGSHYGYDDELGVDFGAIQNGRDISYGPMLMGLKALIASHAHLDHVGGLPAHARENPLTEYYGTSITREITDLHGLDSLKIGTERRAIAELKGQNPAPAFFNEEDVANLYDRFKVVRNTGWFSPIPGYEVSLRSAGHMPGAAMILIKFPDGKRWIHACDLSLTNTELTLGATIPEDFLNPDGITIESTYGARGRKLPDRLTHEKELIAHVKRGLARGAFVVLPSFATTGLNIAALLGRAGIPVKMDGALTKNCTDVYLDAEPWCPNDRPFSFSDYPTISGVGDGGNEERFALLEGEPCAIVSSSGMVEGGPSVFYIKQTAESIEPRNMIILVGYQAEESQGRKLQALQRGQTITFTNEWISRRTGKLSRNIETVAVNAEVVKMQLSGHSDGQTMAPWVCQINPKNVVTVHGDPESHQGMKELIQEINPRINVVSGTNGAELEF